LLRHEEITAPAELVGVQRAIWAIEVPDAAVDATAQPALAEAVLLGGIATYPACRDEAKRLRDRGATGLRAPSAALMPGGARGWRVDGGLQPAPLRNGTMIVLFGPKPDLVGWRVVDQGRPGPEVLEHVRPLMSPPDGGRIQRQVGQRRQGRGRRLVDRGGCLV